MIPRALRFLSLVLLTGVASAASIEGTVTNKTTNKPSAGDEVILLKLTQGMEEAGRVTTDAKGHYAFSVDTTGSPAVIRVVHQKVTYHHPAPPGTTKVDVDVYDVASEVKGIKEVANWSQLQTENGVLQVKNLFVIQNDSKPPLSKMSDKPFEFYLPPGAQLDGGQALSQGSMPVNSTPVPEGDNKYALVFPLRPGMTEFEVAYHLPYTGQTTIESRLAMPTETFAVQVPKSMQVSAESSALQPSTEQDGMNVYIQKNLGAGQKVSFQVSGTGVPPREQQGQQPSSTAADNGPGGGLGVPIDTPDPLSQYRWPILGVIAIVLVGGAWFMMRPAGAAHAGVASGASGGVPSGGGKGNLLLDALKDELFELESERISGKIKPADYANAKAALDLILARAMARGGRHAAKARTS